MTHRLDRNDIDALVRLAAEAAAEKKADEIVALRVSESLVVTDWFLLANGANDRQVASIVDEVEEQLRERGGVKPIGREGEPERKWVLLDYGDFVVHVFQPDEREFYRLERLWADAPRLDLSGIDPSQLASERGARGDAEEPAAGPAS